MKHYLDYAIDSFARVFKLDYDPDVSEDENVRLIIHQTAFVCSALTWLQPIPLADFVLLAPLHIKMTLHIGVAKNFELTEDRARDVFQEVFASVGMSYIATQVIVGVGKFVPVLFGIYLFPLFYASTWAMGKAIEYYFDCRKNGRRPDPEDLKRVYKKALVTGKSLAAKLKLEDIKEKAQELKERFAPATETPATTDQAKPSPPPIKLKPRVKKPKRANSGVDPIDALENLQRKLKAGDIDADEWARERQRILEDL